MIKNLLTAFLIYFSILSIFMLYFKNNQYSKIGINLQDYYYALFKAEADKRHIKIPPENTVLAIKKASALDKVIFRLGEDAVGLCFKLNMFMGLIDLRVILLLPERYSINQEKDLVFHEFGHCYLDLKHVNFSLDIMYPYLQNFDENDADLWKYRIDRFFQQYKRTKK